jgi:hypothetical protein
MARFYLLACFAGTLLPFAAFGEWITHHGFSPILLIMTIWQQPLALFAWLDVIVTALVLIIFADLEGRKVDMPCRWVTPLQPAAWDPHLGYRCFCGCGIERWPMEPLTSDSSSGLVTHPLTSPDQSHS